MMRAIALTAATFAMMASSPASACLASGPDGYATGNVWQNKQSDRPSGSVQLKITEIEHVGEGWGYSGLVNEGPDYWIGKRVRFASIGHTSCNAIGAAEGYIVVSGETREMPGRDGKDVGFLQAYDYEESWWNFILRLFGGAFWQYAGDVSVSENG